MLHRTLKDRHELPQTPFGVIPAHIGHAHVKVGGEEERQTERGGSSVCRSLCRPGGETGICARISWKS